MNSDYSREKITHTDYAKCYPVFDDQIQTLITNYESHVTGGKRRSGTQERSRSAHHGKHRQADDHQPDLNLDIRKAVINNEVEKLETLLLNRRRRAVNINATIMGELRLIHIAAQLGHDDIIDLLKVSGGVFVTEKSPVHPIFSAALGGKIKTIHKLLTDYKTDIDLVGHSGETILHIAVTKDNQKLVEELLKAGANPDVQDNSGFTPILLAALRGNLSIFETLKSHNACMGTRTNKCQYVFHFMAMHERFYHHLKKYRAFYTVLDNRDCTCLHFAVVSGNLKALREIIRHGIHQLDLSTGDRFTAATLACATGQDEILDYLLAKYYSGHKRIEPHESPVKDMLTPTHVVAEHGNLKTLLVLEKHGILDIHSQTPKRRFSPLHLCCISGKEDIAQYIISKGADVRVTDTKGWFPIHHAAQNLMVSACKAMLPSFTPEDFTSGTTLLHLSCKGGSFELAKLLLEAGHDPTILDKLGYSALHYTSSRGYVEIIELLLKYNAKIHRTSSFQETPIFLACINGRVDAVIKLKEAGANINIPNQEGKKAFHEACRRGHAEVVEAVLAVPRMKMNINARTNNDGLAPLQVACESNQPTIAGILIREGADIEVTDHNGMTPMHHAAAKGHYKIVESLVQLGAKRKTRDNHEMMPADYATKNGHDNIAHLLKTFKNAHVDIKAENNNVKKSSSIQVPRSNSFLKINSQ